MIFLRRAQIVSWILMGLILLLRPYAQSGLGRDDMCGAAYYGKTVSLYILLWSGADPSRVGWEYHFTPLGNAMRNGQLNAVKILLKHGADPNAPGDWDKGALQAARYYPGVCANFRSETCKEIKQEIMAAGGHE